MHTADRANVRGVPSRLAFSFLACVVLMLSALSAQASRYVYDDSGQVIGVIDHSGQAARYHYDAVGNLLSIDAPTAGAVVFDMQPDRGPPGTIVRVLGNAMPDSALPQIQFNGAIAQVTNFSAHQVDFVVPSVAAGTHALTLDAAGAVLALGGFEVTTGLGPPTITSVSHSCAKFDTVISLIGSNFDVRPSATRVEVGGRLARVTAISESAISFRAPLHTPGGPVRVTTESGSALSSTVLYLVPTTGDPCAGMTTGGELQIDGGAANATMSTTQRTVELAFFAERGQWLSVQFANPTLASFGAEVTVLAPEGRKQALVDIAGYQAETRNISTTSMSVHLMPITRTGFHVVQVKLTSSSALSLDMRIASAPRVTRDSIHSYQLAPGQWLRSIYTGLAGDQLGLGLTAQNSTPENIFSSLYTHSADHQMMTPEVGSQAGCSEGGTMCTLNVKPLAVAGEYPIIFVPQSSVSTIQATLWVNDDSRPQLQPNIVQPIAITRPGQNARFPVYAEAGSGFSINVRNVTLTPANGSVNFWLYAPDGTRITTKLAFGATSGSGYFSSSGGIVSAFQLPTTGVYTAVLDPAGGGLASGEIMLDPGIALTVDGQAVAVSSTGTGRAGRFVIDGVAGQKIGVGIRNIQLTPSASQWLGVQLYQPSGDLVAGTTFALCYHQTPSYPGCEFDLGPLPYTGRYVVVLNSSTGLTAASYEILASSDVERGLNGTAQSVQIQRQGGNARLYFDAAPGAGKTIHIDSQITGPTGPGTYVNYGVLRPDGYPLVAPLYSAAQNWSSNPFTLRIGDFPLAGTYTLFVDPWYAATATLNARISDGVMDNSQVPQLVPVVPGPWFWYGLTGVVGSHPSVGVHIQSLTGSTNSMKIEVVDPLNRRLADYDSTQPETTCTTYNQYYCDFDFFEIGVGGTYQVVVWPGTARREDAQLTISTVNDFEISDRDGTFNIDQAGQNSRLNFEAASGEMLKLTLTRLASSYPATDIWVYVFDPLGNRIAFATFWYGASSFNWNLPTIGLPGTYSIVMDTRYGTPVSLRAQVLPR